MYRMFLLLLALSAGTANAKIYQCADGRFQDAPCAEEEAGIEIKPQLGTASQPTAEIWDGLPEIETVNVDEPRSVRTSRKPSNACQMDYTTKAAIAEGLRTWKVTNCMDESQVTKITRGRAYKSFRHQNGVGQDVIEWVFEGKDRPRRVTFLDGKVSSVR